MSISIVGTPASLFNVLGRIAAVVKNLRAYQDQQLSAMIDPSVGIVAGLDDEADVQAVTGAGYIGALSSSGGSVGPLMQQQAAAVVNRLVFRDAPRLGQTLTQSSTLASLQEVIRQMKAGGFTVRRCSVSCVPGVFSAPATGDAVITASAVRPFDGLPLENVYAEQVNVVCDQDSYLGGATAYQESMRITGTGSQGDVFGFDWPLGSNASMNLGLIDGAVDAGGGNLLTNSGFDAFTDDVPDNWTVINGTAGTDFAEETSSIFRGASALKLIGTASATLVSLRQGFDSTAGTVGQLGAAQQVSLAVWMRRDALALASGTLRVSLLDGNGNVMSDQAGNANVQDFDLTTLTVDYAPFTAVFRTPLSITGASLQFELTVAVPDGRAVYLDLMSLGLMGQMYTSGPFFAGHSGQVPSVVNDQTSVQILNGRGAGGTLDTWQTALARLFPEVIGNELLFPSSNSPNVADSLIS